MAAEDDPNTLFLPFIGASGEPATPQTSSGAPDDPGLPSEPLDVFGDVDGVELDDEIDAEATGTTYYVDCAAGNDGRSGTSQADAWRTMGKANGANLLPGDRLNFKRGCSWSGPLDASWHGTAGSPIVISSYGSGELPKIQDGYSSSVRISGSYLILENLHATLSSPPSPDPNCNNQPVGWKAGFSFQNGASNNVVQHSKASKLAIGIFFNADSHHNKALHNTIVDNNVVWELVPTRTLGAMGILLQGDNQEVGFNYFENNRTICTYTGTVESNSIELYAATNAYIHHNISYYDRVFSELGSSAAVQSSNNTYAYNLHVASISSDTYGARFVVTRGWNHPYGPVLGTKLYNNTVYLTGSGSKAVVCEKCGLNILTMKNNILWANREPLWIDGQFVESNNLYWSGGAAPLMRFNGLVLSLTSRVADPRFVDPGSGKFNLRADSPAVDAGVNINLESTFDLLQTVLPVDTNVDVGAYEYRNGPWQRVYSVPGRIEAENYREGGQGVGYNDTTGGNSGRAYRTDRVDIEATEDGSGEYNVGWMESGEWLSYDVYVERTGNYRFTLRAATPSGNRRFRVEVDGVDVSGSVRIPWTGGWQTWTNVPVTIPLTAGSHVLRFVAETNRFNVNYFLIEPDS